MTRNAQSLKNRFKKLSVRWSFIGLALTTAAIVPTVFLVVKHSSERQVEVMATALTRAFRPMILQDGIRDAQDQMREVAKLKAGESVSVFDSKWKPAFKGVHGSPIPDHCPITEKPCWLSGARLISVALPIFFDEKNSELYGYLVLSLKPNIDWFAVLAIIFGAGLVFFLHTRAVYSSLKRELNGIEDVLSNWKNRIDNPKSFKTIGNGQQLFTEFLPLDASVKGLNDEIEKLKLGAAEKAKVDVIRGISHDLKTPLSQISKFVAILVANTSKSGRVDEREVKRIEGTLARMGSLIRQVTNLGRVRETPTLVNLSHWIEAYCNELRLDSTVSERKISILSDCSGDPHIWIGDTDLFRIVDNLVRNSLEALPEEGSHVVALNVATANGTVLKVSDTGKGIPKEIQSKVFDLDFTTKKTRGTGLGLGIVKKICTDSGLSIEFTTENGRGTTFSVVFPPVAMGLATGIPGEKAV